MRAPVASTGPNTSRYRRARFARRGLISLVYGAAIGVVLSLGFNRPFWPTLVNSMSIAFACWFFIDAGRMLVADLVLRVRDTGTGLAGTGNDGIGEQTQFGLAQVRERLTALYGARAALTLRAAGDAEGGTLATIRLPWATP